MNVLKKKVLAILAVGVLAIGAWGLVTTLGEAAGTTYYVDPSGSDNNAGTSETAAWATLNQINSLADGDTILLKRDGTWPGGVAVNPSITIGAFGTGAAAPLIQGGDCLRLDGAGIVVENLHIDDCNFAGVKMAGGSGTVQNSLLTNSVAGIQTTSANNLIINNTFIDNNKMSVLTSGGDDDSGAFGVLLNSDDNEVAFNSFSGHDAFSYDYGRDGAAVEIYNGSRNFVHHNIATENDTFSELGGAIGGSADNVYAYNVVTSTLESSLFLVTPGWVSGTILHNNSAYLSGARSQGVVCYSGCGPDKLVMRNNIVQAVWKAGYADAPFDGSYNLYWGGTRRQFYVDTTDIEADPLFTSVSDLRLQLGSLAIDSGVDLGYLQDADGNPVPQGAGVDRGAYESDGTMPPTNTPGPPPTATEVPPTPPPTATPDPASAVTILAAGDIKDCGWDGAERVANVMRAVPGQPAVLTMGDNAYEDGTAWEFANCYDPAWGEFKDRTYPSPGNHDYHTSAAAPYYDYFGSVAAGPNGWYSYDLGTWRLISLNSECGNAPGGCGEMSTWLAAELAQNPNQCTLAYWHRPTITAGPHNWDENGLRFIWQQLYDADVDVVLAGHDHSYQRYARLNRNADGVDPNGMRQIIAGTGGRGLSTITRPNTSGLEVFGDQSNNAVGVLKMTLGAGWYDWEYLAAYGSSFTDSGADTCRGGPQPPTPTPMPTATETPIPTATPSMTPTATATPTPTATSTPTPMPTATSTPTSVAICQQFIGRISYDEGETWEMIWDTVPCASLGLS